VGIVLRGHNERVTAVRSFTRLGFLEPTTAEAVVTVLAVQFCKEMGVQNVILEGDAEVIIKALQAQGQNGSRYGQLVEDARLILGSLSSWKTTHVRRNTNGGACSLAKLATKNVMDRTWKDICDIVKVKQIALA
jgi:ribonuclease HI